ncbi:pLS20_p028 family conjugation system transmembrane protein [Lysinibacillus capsici]|uniref:pLS20_p028 family conjugation system transmembrane protein n=1 Tax=Lysinibacillus capsici TaxID=2115968 RepID=UPI0034E37BB4
MEDNEIIEKHKILESILHVSDGFLWQDVFRALGSGIIYTLSWLNQLLEDIVTKIITLNDFYATGAMGEFMDKARPLIWIVFFIALVVLGFQFMLNKVEKRNEILLNIVMAVCFIVIIPDLMSNMQKIIGVGMEQMNPENETLASNMIKSNVADVLYYAEHDFQFASSTRGDESSPPRPASKEDSSIGTTDYTYANRFSDSSALHVPFLQKLDLHEDDGWLFKEDWVKQLSDESKEVLKTKSVPTGVGDSYQVEELQDNAVPMTKIGRETYYRYHVNWLSLIVSLLVTSIALGITVLKIGRAIFDLAFHQIFGMFIAASDLTGGQRTKKVLVEMVNTFVVIFIMTGLLQLFVLFVNWANGLKTDIGMLGVIILMIAGAWALIDAPDIVQRTLGIDAGLRNGWQAMMGAYAGGKALTAGAQALKNVAQKGVATVAGGANMAKRTVEGMRTETPSEVGKRTSVPAIPGSGDVKSMPKSDEQHSNSTMGGTSDPIPSSVESDGLNAYDQIAATSQDYEPIPSSVNSNQVDMPGSMGSVQPGQIPSQGGKEKGSPSIQPKTVTTPAKPPTNTSTSDVSQRGAMQRQESQPVSGSPSVDSSIQSVTGQDGDMHQGPIQRQEHEPIPSSEATPSEGISPQPSTPGVTRQVDTAATIPTGGPNVRQTSEAIPSEGISPQPSTPGVTRQVDTAATIPTGGPNVRQISETIPSEGISTQSSTPGVTRQVDTAATIPTGGPNVRQTSEAIPSEGISTHPSTSSSTSSGNVPMRSNVRQTSEVIPPGRVTQQAGTSGVITPSSTGNVSTGSNKRQTNETIPSVGVGPQPNTSGVTAPTVIGNGHQTVTSGVIQQGSSGNVQHVAPQNSTQAQVVSQPTGGSNVVQQGPVVSTVGGQGGTVQPNQKSITIDPKTYGHKQVVHTNTILGGNPSVQQLKESVTRAGNSGFTLGQNIRRMTNNIGKRKRQGSDQE